MKFHLEATPDELVEKSGKLVETLSDLFRAVAPDLSESLEKALPQKEKILKFPVTQALQKQTAEIYQKHMDKMLGAIGKVLDQSVEKSGAGDSPDLSKGWYCEVCGAVSPGERCEHLEKAYDHTKPVADKDDVAYKRVKQVLIRMGWEAADFEAGGPLYGWSVNQLLELAKGLGVPLLFGSPGYMQINQELRPFNAAYLVSSQGKELGNYQKIHLVRLIL